jgi:hypothetical protein
MLAALHPPLGLFAFHLGQDGEVERGGRRSGCPPKAEVVSSNLAGCATNPLEI